MPRYLQITRAAGPMSGPRDPEHMARVRKSIDDAVASGRMLATGGIGKRATSAARIVRSGGKILVEDPPLNSDDTWMAGGGYALNEYASKEEAIADCAAKLDIMGDGVMELIQVGEMYPPAKAPTVATKDGAAATVPLPGVIPYFSVEGATAASDFYTKAFGAKEVRRQPAEDGKRLMHCQMEVNGGTIMFSDTFPEYGHGGVRNGYTMQLVLGNGQVWWDRAIAAGCTVETPYERAFWGDKFGTMRDPFGVTWAISSPEA